MNKALKENKESQEQTFKAINNHIKRKIRRNKPIIIEPNTEFLIGDAVMIWFETPTGCKLQLLRHIKGEEIITKVS